MAAQPVGFLIDPVADDDQRKEDAHQAGDNENAALNEPADTFLRQRKGDQEGENSQIQRDDLIPLGLLQTQLRDGPLIEIRQIHIQMGLADIVADGFIVKQLLFLFGGTHRNISS